MAGPNIRLSNSPRTRISSATTSWHKKVLKNIEITFSKYIYSVEFRFCQPRNRFQRRFLSFSSAMAIQVSFRLVHRKLFPSSLLKLIHITISLTIANGMTEGNFFCKLTIFLCLKLREITRVHHAQQPRYIFCNRYCKIRV